MAVVSCDRTTGVVDKGPHVRKVASLVPAATEMLVGMGLGDHLVAVSNFESSQVVKGLPRVGDYQSTDWETLARLRPDVMVIQIHPDRVPPGMKERAAGLGIELVNVRIDRLDDIFKTATQLGGVCGELDRTVQAVSSWNARLETVRRDCATKPPCRVLMFRDGGGQNLVGTGNFLDDVLNVVHATNAAEELRAAWPSVDRETIVRLAPEAVMALMPDASAGALDGWKQFWSAMPGVPAVQKGRVYTVTQGTALVPGPGVVDLAERVAGLLYSGVR